MALIGKYYFEHDSENKKSYVVLQSVGSSGGLLTLELKSGNQVKALSPGEAPDDVTDRAFFALQGN